MFSDSQLHLAATLVFGTAGIAVMTCAFYGWGWLTRRLAALPHGTWPVTAALGLAFAIFLGGILNLCRAAVPLALAGIAIIGLALAGIAIRQGRIEPVQWRGVVRAQRHMAPWGLATLILTGFTVATQLAPSFYNHADDFTKNFAHVVRMVETGTLYGSPLNALGTEALGGQSILQGFIVGYFPLAFINSADAVFCFWLCLALAGSVAFGRPAVGLAASVGALAVFLIDPQYENVSSLYSTVAIIAALMIVRVDPREGGERPSSWRQATAPALLSAAAIALKPTSCVFLVFQFGAGAVISAWGTGDWRTRFAHAAQIPGLSAMFLAPWLLLYSPYYLIALRHPIDTALADMIAGGGVSEIRQWHDLLLLLSPKTTFYGAPILAYTCLAAGLILCAIVVIPRHRVDVASLLYRAELGAAAVAAAAAYLFWVIVGPQQLLLTDTLRYSIPVLIGATSVALPLRAALTARGGITICAVVAMLLLVLFASSTRQRVGTLLHQGSQLSYLHHWERWRLDRNREFVHRALNGELKAEVQRLQEQVPPGQTFLGWTAAPFLFDFSRNVVLDANIAGLAQPWGRIPATRYIIWQHSEYGRTSEEVLKFEITRFGRRIAQLDARALDVLQWLQEIRPNSKTISDEDGVIVMQVDEKSYPPPD
jgi:hypothetical protein